MIHVLNMKTLENRWYDVSSGKRALILANEITNGMIGDEEMANNYMKQRRDGLKFIVSQYTIQLGDWATFKKAATAYIADHKRR